MSDGAPIVCLLDDEPDVVAALGRILQAQGYAIRAWTSAHEFLSAHDGTTPGCLVSAARMSGMTGLEIRRVLLARGIDRPTIFTTDEGDIRTTVLGMKAGAVTFLTKPVRPAELIGAVREAIATDATRRAHRCEQADISARLARLTPREWQVLSLLTFGLLNKQIAAELGTAKETITAHRRHILFKMEVRSTTALMGLLYRARLDVHEVTRSVGLRPSSPHVLRWRSGRGGRLSFRISRAAPRLESREPQHGTVRVRSELATRAGAHAPKLCPQFARD